MKTLTRETSMSISVISVYGRPSTRYSTFLPTVDVSVISSVNVKIVSLENLDIVVQEETLWSR